MVIKCVGVEIRTLKMGLNCEVIFDAKLTDVMVINHECIKND